jgi:hypothetical protein
MKISSSDILSKLRDVRDARIEGRDQASIDNDYWLQGYTKAINDIIALEKAERVDDEESAYDKLYKSSESVALFVYDKDSYENVRIGFKGASDYWTIYLKDQITFGAAYCGRWKEVISKYDFSHYLKKDGLSLDKDTVKPITITSDKVYLGGAYGISAEL